MARRKSLSPFFCRSSASAILSSVIGSSVARGEALQLHVSRSFPVITFPITHATGSRLIRHSQCDHPPVQTAWPDPTPLCFLPGLIRAVSMVVLTPSFGCRTNRSISTSPVGRYSADQVCVMFLSMTCSPLDYQITAFTAMDRLSKATALVFRLARVSASVETQH